MPKREIKPIFVRLTEAERRSIRTLAVSQGLTMREAILQAFEAWASQLPSVAVPSGRSASFGAETSRASAGARSKKRRQPERASMGQQLLRPDDTRPSEVGPSLADVPGLKSLGGDWVSNAAQLD